MQTIKQLEDWLYAQPRGLKRLDMTFMTETAQKLGIDTTSLNIIHVTGTNGKGSTIAYLSAILQAHGKSVAAFTSPHLFNINERFMINNRAISDEKLCQYVATIRQSQLHLSQFEIMTLAFFLFVQNEKVDYVLLEVGIGGLLDTTNFITPIASIITSVGLDHMELLGDTIGKIAYQKAGIIKSNIPVFIGRLDRQAIDVISDVAHSQSAPLIKTADRFPVYNHQLITNGVALDIVLQGEYQKDNLTLALIVAREVLDTQFSLETAKQGICNVQWKGRFETVIENPCVIVDGAHNPHGIQGLIDTLHSERYQQYSVQILFAALSKKDYVAMLMLLQQHFPVALTTFDVTKTQQKQLEYTNVPDGIEFVEDYKEYVKAYLKQPTSDILVVTGSLYFVSEFKKFVENEKKSFIL